MSKAASAVARKASVAVVAEPNPATKKVGAASGPLDKRLQVKSNADDDDWSKWNIQELRTSMVEDRANLQVSASMHCREREILRQSVKAVALESSLSPPCLSPSFFRQRCVKRTDCCPNKAALRWWI